MLFTGEILLHAVAVFLSIDFTSCQDVALFPGVFNLASHAVVTANATCGENGLDIYCKLVEHVKVNKDDYRQCDVCDAFSKNPSQRHPISNAVDGSNSWWQSPTIANGREYNNVTITIDLGQVYQIAYVVIKAANAPRPGSWILERSLDGATYKPWQYFAMTDYDCWTIYQKPPMMGSPTLVRDDEVICTSAYSRLDPLENGEIFVSLINGRPGVEEPSAALLDFTAARYVQLRLQRIRTLNADLMTFRTNDPKHVDPSVTRRYFYSIKDISIGGQCICYGHAKDCHTDDQTGSLKCECFYNTCGNNCEVCCPMFNQQPWKRGANGHKVGCEECNCHNHAVSCTYNATVADQKLSIDINGIREGGGICENCQDFTAGINCEHCVPGYYRPLGMSHTSKFPCRPCACQITEGSTGQCVIDDSRVHEGLNPGACLCKPGFAGHNCQQCAPGYQGYPRCQPCHCSIAGSLNLDACSSRCQCKANVFGATCDQCRAGYFNLQQENPDGCMPCFCFGITQQCERLNWGSDKIIDMDGWAITTLDDDTTYMPDFSRGWLIFESRISNRPNFPGMKSTVFYWVAPSLYLGTSLTSYGGILDYTIIYERGDSPTSTYHLAEPNVIIQGQNLTATNNRGYLRENTEQRYRIRLVENNWFSLEPSGQISSESLTKADFMMLLTNLEKILIRATYHTGQRKVQMKSVTLDVASPIANISSMQSVEKCDCPPAYSGLSCENCAFGYRRLSGGGCEACNCNGHANTCNIFSGNCENCLHNTKGDHCELCIDGFYGDTRRGLPDDCRPCACPLHEPQNNFATMCELAPNPRNRDDYICLDCPPGYTGSRCDRCDIGFFGNPISQGNTCQPCRCGHNSDTGGLSLCDTLTGECLQCASNAEGTNCENCKDGFYGNPIRGGCHACGCDPNGSLQLQCDNRTGECPCKPRYTGRRCQICQVGHGGIFNDCPPCTCNHVGSISTQCDPVTGECSCKLGVAGDFCERCRNDHYGFSFEGCRACDCHLAGTNENTTCDDRTGQCYCQENVIDQNCGRCLPNHWGLVHGAGCKPCGCNTTGSMRDQCNLVHGQCECRHGVTGLQCDMCEPGYYSFSFGGCRKCDPCPLPGHVCDPHTGRCICPPHTDGDNCSTCVNNAWDFHPVRGCKPCSCSIRGSENLQCDDTGLCQCKPEFTGLQCDHCYFGSYGFPHCLPCICGVEGTATDSCKETACQCDDFGQCPCKANVGGNKCTICFPDAFSLREDNPDGCTKCLCFHRSNTCQQAKLIWKQSVAPSSRVFVQPEATTSTDKHHGFNIIPENAVTISIPQTNQSAPVYWSLPQSMLGDMTLSYNGKLRFSTFYENQVGVASSNPVHPLIVLVGNHVVLGYSADIYPASGTTNKFDVHLFEKYWFPIGLDPMHNTTRDLLMVILQDVEGVFIRASADNMAHYIQIVDIELDVAMADNATMPVAYGVEQCECPPQYTGLSCQDPAPGYYRIKPKDPGNLIDLDNPVYLIGRVRPCRCYNHSDTCDRETGICVNCSHNTAGNNCDQCVAGYYGDATRGTPNDCQLCECPMLLESNNFSPLCDHDVLDYVCTNCSEGHSGRHCEQCKPGFYGNPLEVGNRCQRCDCNVEGSVDEVCDRQTGQCVCLPGISGVKCHSCKPRHAVVLGYCVSCDEGCTKELMADIDKMEEMVLTVNWTGPWPVPWSRLEKVKNDTQELEGLMKGATIGGIRDLWNETKMLDMLADMTLPESDAAKMFSQSVANDSNVLNNMAQDLDKEVEDLYRNLKKEISDLEELVMNLLHNESGINATVAIIEAQAILDEILTREFYSTEKGARRENLLSEMLTDQIRNMTLRNSNLSGVQEKLDDVTARIKDLQNKTTESMRRSEEAANLTATGNKQKIDLQAAVDKATDNLKAVNMFLKDGKDLLSDARDLLDMAQENIFNSLSYKEDLVNIIPELRRKGGLLAQNLPNSYRFTTQAEAHADKLRRQAEELERTFAWIKAEAADPIKAANVYKNIVDAINRAAKAANMALENAMHTAEMAYDTHLQNSVKRSLLRSKKLLKQAKTTMNIGIPGLHDRLGNVNKEIKDVEDIIQQLRDGLDMIKNDLNRLPTGMGKRLQKLIDVVMVINDFARNVSMRVNEIDFNIKNDLLPKLEKLKMESAQDYSDIKVKIDQSKSNVHELKNITAIITEQNNRFRVMNFNMSNNLQMLKERIKFARDQANNLRLSLDSSGFCVRSFRQKSQPSTTNSIRFSFKTNSTDQDMLFVLYQGTIKEFLAVELRDSKVRFSWNVGGGTGVVNHSLVIESDSGAPRETEKWYSVEAQRIGRIGSLTVRKLVGAKSDNTVYAASPLGHSIININDDADLFVGGANKDYVVPPGITTNNFTGCMGEVVVDERPVGLSNFKKNSDGCNACKYVPLETVPSQANTFQFLGKGYAAHPQIRSYTSRRTYMAFEFKTYWENAMLYFAANMDSGDFINLQLRGGKIVMQYSLGGISYLRLSTNFTYNTNKWVEVQVNTGKAGGLLRVSNTESIDGMPPPGNTGLELKRSTQYFGGVPDSMDLSGYDVITDKFLGCIRNIQAGSVINLMDGTLVDVQPGCRTMNIRTVGFYGNGFAELDGDSLDGKENAFSLSFVTKEPEALLLLAMNIGKDSYYSISLIGGKIEARLGVGTDQVILKSSKRYDDEMLHNVGLNKINRTFQMFVNDAKVDEGRLPRGRSNIVVRENGGLYIGGVPRGFVINNMAATNKPLNGCITDVVLNGKVLNLNQPRQYERADIGRCLYGMKTPSFELVTQPPFKTTKKRKRPTTTLTTTPVPTTMAPTPASTPASTTPVMTTSTETPTTCSPEDMYEVDEAARSFGNEQFSYAEIEIKRRAVNRDFNISFAFRTFYNYGMLFYLTKPDQSTYLSAQLVDRVVVVTYQDKGDQQNITYNVELADGMWHTVSIIKGKKIIKLQVNGGEPVLGNIARKLDVSTPLYVGGLPKHINRTDGLVSHSIRGCLRNFLINGDLFKTGDSRMVSGIYPCYKKSIRGIYFLPQAYGVYAEKYSIGRSLKMEMQFRTHLQNGILMTISNQGGHPAMTLQLHGGQVKFRVRNKNGEEFAAISQQISNFTLCDKRWHSVQAEWNKGELRLVIDGQSPTFATDPSNIGNIRTRNLFLIGGYPSFAPDQGAALTQESFNGCIRNLSINGTSVDWYQLLQSENIERMSCPIA